MRNRILSALLLICLCAALGGCAYFGKGVEIVVRPLEETADSTETRDAEIDAAAPTQNAPEGETLYVLNTKSHKFHLPDCESVKDIQPGNREDYTGTRDELIEDGFVPCKRCNP